MLAAIDPTGPSGRRKGRSLSLPMIRTPALSLGWCCSAARKSVKSCVTALQKSCAPCCSRLIKAGSFKLNIKPARASYDCFPTFCSWKRPVRTPPQAAYPNYPPSILRERVFRRTQRQPDRHRVKSQLAPYPVDEVTPVAFRQQFQPSAEYHKAGGARFGLGDIA